MKQKTGRVKGSRRLATLRAGFTLLELLVVMSIMLVISTILVSNYFGMTRAASYSAAENDVFNYLQLARQRASLDGTRVFFMLLDDKQSYVLVHGVGALTQDMTAATGGRYRFFDAYADLTEIDDDKSGVFIWNMDKNRYGTDARITPEEYAEDSADGDGRYWRDAYAFELKLPNASESKDWEQGDRYGFELYQRQMLPKGFSFEEKNLTIVFNPDGTSGRFGSGSSVNIQDTTITIVEDIVKDSARNKIEIVVRANGSIEMQSI